MKNYLALSVLWIVGIVVIFFYYIGYPVHGEIKDAFFFLYLLLIGILYGTYKTIQNFNVGNHISIKPHHLIYGFFMQFFLVCIYFFIVSGLQPGLGVVLFFKSISYIIISAFVWLSFYCFGKRILTIHESTKIQDPNIETLVSIGIGFVVTMFLVFLVACFGGYNIINVIVIFAIIVGVSIFEWNDLFYNFLNYRKEYTREVDNIGGNSSLIIDELLFILITFLLSINFLSVFRPFPIGWDDLGVYMNYPKLLSGAGEHIALGKMYVWEMYTGIGFLAGSQTFAFYLNSFAGVIAVIAIYLSINTFTRFTKQKYNFGLLAGSIFLMMPMVVFQIAKDMKMDVGLFSISIMALGLLYYLLFSKKGDNYILFGLLGILIGAAFAIKITSLLLLLGVFASIFYFRYRLIGFVVFLLLFIGIFSFTHLWSIINVVIAGDTNVLTQFGVMSSVIGIGGFIYMVIQKNKAEYSIDIKIFILQILSILVGFCLVLSPWMVKHYGEIPSDYDAGISTLVGGVADTYVVDYLDIYSSEELNLIESVIESGISESGTTSNEDWGRYFGYEQGINNFLKLPWNLTHQVNQKGEFTDITFLFLALIPGVFLFLPYRREIYKYPVIGVMILVLLYYIPSPVSGVLTNIFSTVSLPTGYAVILGLFLLPITYFSFALNKNEKVTSFFLVNLSFLTVYMGLWAVSSYGVVWYGIVMYFILLLLILLCVVSIGQEDKNHSYLSYSILAFVAIYAFQSAIPHGISNMKAAAYSEYKVGGFNEEVSLISYHPEYFSIMYELNVSDDKKQELFIEYRKRLLLAISTTEDFDQVLPQIQAYTSMNELHRLVAELSKVDFPGVEIDEQIKQIRQDLYELIIYTPKEFKNTKNIYRVGTFLKYFISENNIRLFEDGLLTKYSNYIYSDNPVITLERFKKLNIDYVLLDLNAATIDNDPEKNLTKRYEDLLNFLKTPGIELIETDSICLRVATDNFKLEQNLETYLGLASVNHSSEFSQAQKRQACFSVIQQIITNDEALQLYPYLNVYRNAILGAEIDINDANMVVGALGQLIRGNGFKALFKIN